MKKPMSLRAREEMLESIKDKYQTGRLENEEYIA